ncbi:MAG TPA: IMP dehydrogenase [Bdellovibrionota bacterium]|nr:IMP dehydrogenase [Bdellovibrionota bacterium]
MEIRHGFTFDDVLIYPRKSLPSRFSVSTETRITRRHKLRIPIVTANMDTVTESEMMVTMWKLGGCGILHRNCSIQYEVDQILRARQLAPDMTTIAASVGVKDYVDRAPAIVDAGANVITIDIAHGYSDSMLETLEYLKRNFPHVDVIAGNVANKEGARVLIDAGADAIKVGIGGGSMCTTRLVTGFGVPQLTAVMECAEIAFEADIPIISDGGIRYAGDMVKAFVAGAESIMIGFLAASTKETPGKCVSLPGGKTCKIYRGMASTAAREEMMKNVPDEMAAEGVETILEYKGSIIPIIHQLVGGICSGMSYGNASTIKELRECEFVHVTPNVAKENRPHGLQQ